MADTAEWFVRKSDGVEFGPAGLAELVEWAKDGRIAPDDFVSPDGHVWRPAPELADLEMCWMVETEPGVFYGPAHGMAFVEMMREGALRGASRVRQVRTGEETQLILLAARMEAVSAADTLRSRAADLSAEEDASAGPAPERTVSWKSMALEKDRFEHEAVKWKQLYEEDRARIRELEKNLLEATRALERERIGHHAALDQAAREIEALRRAGSLRESAEGPGQLEAAYAELSRGFEALAREQDQKNRELADLRESLRELRRGYEERIALMEEHIRREQAASDAAQARLATAEQAHTEMVAMVRDLNDRYIRLREHQVHPDSAAGGGETPVRPKVRMTRS